MNNPTIAFFISSLTGGGAENVFVVVANEFAKRGFAVDFLIIRSKDEQVRKLDEPIRLINFSKKRLWNALPRLTSYLLKNKPKILFFNISLPPNSKTSYRKSWHNCFSPWHQQ